MKKRIFLFLATHLICLAIFAQQNIGLSLGALRTSVETTQEPYNPNLLVVANPLLRGQVGVYKNFVLKGRFSLQTHISYELKGFKKLSNPALETYTPVNMHYISLFPKLRYKVNDFIFGFGPKASFLLYVPNYNNYKKIEFALTGEVGYSFNKFSCLLNYNYALTPYTSRVFLGGNVDYKSRYLALLFEIPLKIGK